MIAEAAILASLTVPGRVDQVRPARRFVTRVLSGHPCTDIAVQLASELVANSVTHSDSRGPGGEVTITVTGDPGVARVEVRDGGGASVPHVEPGTGAWAEDGRGLMLVSQLADQWGYQPDGTGRITWFEVSAEPRP